TALPTGFRARWSDRGALCAAKLAGRLTRSTVAGHFPGILLGQGATSHLNEFLERHIRGPLTIRSTRRATSPRRPHAAVKSIRETLKKMSIKVGEWTP